MRKLPRTKDDRVIVQGSVWNRLCDEVERIDKLDVAPPLQLHDGPDGKLIGLLADAREPNPGIVVCNGPHGEPDFSDHRYWVQTAYLANGEDGGEDGGENDPTEVQKYVKFQPGEERYAIVCVENDFERNCKTHNVRPGTKLEFWTRYDKGTPQVKRYLTLVMDEGTCGMPECGSSDSTSSSSSSSSSTSDYCLYRWDCDYDCNDGWGAVHGPNKNCVTAADGPAVTERWVRVPGPEGVCRYAFYRWGNGCPGPEQTADCDDPGETPDVPDFIPPNCCYYCLYRWDSDYDCETQTWSAVAATPNKDCVLPQDGPAVTEEWVRVAAPDGVCRYAFYRWGRNCPGNEHTTPCTDFGDRPDAPEFTPDDCCNSSSSASRMRCVYQWKCKYDCATKTWGMVERAGHSCVEPSAITHGFGHWSFGHTATVGDASGSGNHDACEYVYFAMGAECTGGEGTECHTWPSTPAPPTDPPADEHCPCASSSSSGSESEGSSSGDCVDVIKADSLSFTFDPDTCTVTPHFETVRVRKCDVQ